MATLTTVPDSITTVDASHLLNPPTDSTKFGTDGFNKYGFRLMDKDENIKFEILQSCSVNGNCPGNKALDRPLEYTLRNLKQQDTGWYSCKADNSYGHTITSGYVKVVDVLPTDPQSMKLSQAQTQMTWVIVAFVIAFVVLLVFVR